MYSVIVVSPALLALASGVLGAEELPIASMSGADAVSGSLVASSGGDMSM